MTGGRVAPMWRDLDESLRAMLDGLNPPSWGCTCPRERAGLLRRAKGPQVHTEECRSEAAVWASAVALREALREAPRDEIDVKRQEFEQAASHFFTLTASARKEGS